MTYPTVQIHVLHPRPLKTESVTLMEFYSGKPDILAASVTDYCTGVLILIIDRNRFHPVTPIKNPGGALRAMTRRFGQGKLNLVGGLIGLSERSKVDQK